MSQCWVGSTVLSELKRWRRRALALMRDTCLLQVCLHL